MKIYQSLFYTISLFFLLNNFSFAQERYTPVPESKRPEEKSEYRSYSGANANLSQGIVDISVPIYEIVTDGLEIPLKVSYNTKGVKVNQESSMVGLGWNFDLPSIYQRVNDEDDLHRFSDSFYNGYLLPHQGATSPFQKTLRFESILYIGSNPQTYGSYLLDLSTGSTPVPSCDYYIATRKELPDLNGNYHDVDNVHFSSTAYPIPDIFYPTGFGVDTEPDYFSLKLFGKEINFIYDFESGEIEILGDSLYEIIFNDNSNNFKVVSPSEVTYLFNLHVPRYSYSSNDSFDNVRMGGSFSEDSEWLLTKIITSKGREVNFEYNHIPRNIVNEGGNNLDYLGYQRTERDGQFDIHFSYPAITIQWEGECATISNTEPVGAHTGIIESLTKSLSDKYYIEKISFDGGQIDFQFSGRDDVANYEQPQLYKKMDLISIKDFELEEVLDFEFNYSHFNASSEGGKWRENYHPEDIKRLRLDKIFKNGELFRSFEYDSQNLPDKTSYATDYWGYYNGEESNVSYAPNPQRFINAGILPSNIGDYDNTNNHSANVNYAKAGILTKMILETKGYEKYYYELNDYVSTGLNRVPSFGNSSDIVKGAGLRIQRIELHDNDSSNTLLGVREFEYGEGVLPNPLKFFKDITVDYKYMTSVSSDTTYGGLICSQTNFFQSPIFTYDNIVFYTQATERFTNLTDESNSYSVVSKYAANPYNYFPNYAVGINNYYEVYNPGLPDRDSVSNGTILEREFYNDSDDLVKREIYTYEKRKSDLFYGVKTRFISMWGAYNGTQPLRLENVPRHSIEYYPIYFDRDYLSSTETVEYFDEGNITTLEERSYDAKWRLDKLKTFSGSDIIEVDYNYNDNYLITKPREILTVKMLNNTVSMKKEYYNYSSAYNPILGNVTYFLNSKDICEQYHQNLDSDCYREEYHYNELGDLKEFINGDRKETTFLWGYNANYPIAKIQNATFSEVATALGITESDLKDFDESDLPIINGLRDNTALSESMITTYTYDPLIGMRSDTDPRGYTTYYEYDNFNRLEVIRDAEGNKIKEYNYNLVEQVDSETPPPSDDNYNNFSVSVVSSDYLSPLPPSTCPTSICTTGGVFTKSIQLSSTTAPAQGVQIYVNGEPATSNKVAAEWGAPYSTAGIKWIRFYSDSSNTIWEVNPATGIIQGPSSYECGTTNCD